MNRAGSLVTTDPTGQRTKHRYTDPGGRREKKKHAESKPMD